MLELNSIINNYSLTQSWTMHDKFLKSAAIFGNYLNYKHTCTCQAIISTEMLTLIVACHIYMPDLSFFVHVLVKCKYVFAISDNMHQQWRKNCPHELSASPILVRHFSSHFFHFHQKNVQLAV